MKTIKSLLILSTLVILSLTSCKKDTEAPVISKITVDGTEVTNGSEGEHMLGSTIAFKIDATDDKELTLYQVNNASNSSALLDEGTLTGTSGNFTYNFPVDTATYVAGGSIVISFLVQDGNGLSADADYTIRIQ